MLQCLVAFVVLQVAPRGLSQTLAHVTMWSIPILVCVTQRFIPNLSPCHPVVYPKPLPVSRRGLSPISHLRRWRMEDPL